MALRKSSSRSLERRAVLDALARIACRFRTDTLIAWLPVLTVLAADERLPATPGMVQRFDEKLRLLRLFGALRETTPRHKASDNEIAQRVCDMARSLDADVRVSPRSLRRWKEQYNAVSALGLAGGPMALLDRYESGSRPV